MATTKSPCHSRWLICRIPIPILWEYKLGSSSWPKRRCFGSLLRATVYCFACQWILLTAAHAGTVARAVSFSLPLISTFLEFRWSFVDWLFRIEVAVHTVLLLVNVSMSKWKSLQCTSVIHRRMQGIVYAVSEWCKSLSTQTNPFWFSYTVSKSLQQLNHRRVVLVLLYWISIRIHNHSALLSWTLAFWQMSCYYLLK